MCHVLKNRDILTLRNAKNRRWSGIWWILNLKSSVPGFDEYSLHMRDYWK